MYVNVTKKITGLTALFMTSVIAFVAVASHHQSPEHNMELPAADMNGMYGGTFLCSAGEMGMTLSIQLDGFPTLDDFPGQTVEELENVTKRLSSILKCTAISDPASGEPQKIKLELTLNTLGEEQSEFSVA